MKKKSPQLVPLEATYGGLFALFICSWLLSKAYKAQLMQYFFLFAN
jgi:hypothetical protein